MKRSAFTLVELLVVIAIIGLIASLSVIALGNARQKSRDSKRVADVKQVQTALELFFSDQGRYPTAAEWNSGSLAVAGSMGTTTYMDKLPTAQTGGTCNNNYSYAPNSTGDNYTLNFCLESGTGSLAKGVNFAKASSSGIKDSDLVGWWEATEATSTTVIIDKTGNNNNLTLVNGASIVANCRKTGESCLDFDGVNDHGLIDVQNTLLDMGLGEVSISMWLKLKSSAYEKVIFSNNSSLGGVGYGVTQYNTSVGCNVYKPATSIDKYCASNPVTVGTWVYITKVFSRSAILSYINGVKTTTDAIPNYENAGYMGYNNPANDVIVGGYPGSSTYSSSIMMSDIRVYKKVLTDDEVLAIYNATK